MTDRKIDSPAARSALRSLARVGVKALRYSAGGFTSAELRDIAADLAEITIALVEAIAADGEG
jgi:Holliday junction resolvase